MPEEREDEEREESYHKVDKRVGHHAEEAGTDPSEEPRSPAGPPEGEEAGTDPQTATAPPPGEEAERGEEEALQIDMFGLLRMMFSMCLEQAWVHMGLHLAPGAQETQTDLRQARLAIDTIAYIKEALGDDLQDAERREVEQILSTLRMNFIQRS